jgi:hypothetical protein
MQIKLRLTLKAAVVTGKNRLSGHCRPNPTRQFCGPENQLGSPDHCDGERAGEKQIFKNIGAEHGQECCPSKIKVLLTINPAETGLRENGRDRLRGGLFRSILTARDTVCRPS